MEALRSSLMGIFEKRRMKKFMEFIQKWDDKDPSTHQGSKDIFTSDIIVVYLCIIFCILTITGVNLDKDTMGSLYTKFGLEPGTRDFIGHAMALYLDDDYIMRTARETYDRIILYVSSMARYGKSPYIYPLYGLGELPQGFARLSAIYGGTYMLEKPVDEIVYNKDGKFEGVRSGDEIARADVVFADPSYFPDKVQKTGRVIRAICILTHPIPNTDNSDSVQIVIPQNQVGRKHDIYVAMVSSSHNIAPKDHYLAIVSTIVETQNPHLEIEPGLKLLGPILERFIEVSDLYEPLEDGTKDNVFISKSYDATSHFETTADDVMDIYERSQKKKLVLKQRPTAVCKYNFKQELTLIIFRRKSKKLGWHLDQSKDQGFI